jgi:hypothetical protein
MAYKRTTRTTSSNGRITSTINTRTGKQTHSFSYKIGSTRTTTSQTNKKNSKTITTRQLPNKYVSRTVKANSKISKSKSTRASLKKKFK